MLTNGEFKDVEFPLLITTGVILLFANLGDAPAAPSRPRLTRAFICCLCALLVSDIYMGTERFRVRAIGWHAFFEWDEEVKPGIPFFADMLASSRFAKVLDEIQRVREQYPGTVCLGPRLEFAYGALGISSPLHMPVWWDPGTAFAPDRLPEVEAAWRATGFRTVIFLKRDTVYYRKEFVDEIRSRYETEEVTPWPDLTVFHSETPGGVVRSSR
jgi:hypothetical protein